MSLPARSSERSASRAILPLLSGVPPPQNAAEHRRLHRSYDRKARWPAAARKGYLQRATVGEATRRAYTKAIEDFDAWRAARRSGRRLDHDVDVDLNAYFDSSSSRA